MLCSTRIVHVTGRDRTMEVNLLNSSIQLNDQHIYGPEAILQEGK
ncbi:hypothetical protein ACH8E3_14185 [Paenibacillus sp. CMAA1364]